MITTLDMKEMVESYLYLYCSTLMVLLSSLARKRQRQHENWSSQAEQEYLTSDHLGFGRAGGLQLHECCVWKPPNFVVISSSEPIVLIITTGTTYKFSVLLIYRPISTYSGVSQRGTEISC